VRLAYIASRYPAVSHTFILREVTELRARGHEVVPFTVRRVPPDTLLSAADRAEAERTEAILPTSAGRQLRAHLSAVRRVRARYLATLRYAIGASPGGVRNTLWQVFYFLEAVQLWDDLRRRGVPHVHAHFANVASDVALLASRLGSPGPRSWSFTMHGTGLDDVTATNLPLKTSEARAVICISDWTRSQLMKMVAASTWDKLRVVRCGVDPERFTPEPEPRSGGPLRILFLGRLVPEKGATLLIDALADVRSRGIDAELTMAGDGPLGDDLRKLAAQRGVGDHVTFPGVINQDEVVSLYRDHDVFCMPSLREGVPVVYMEAMACGLPVIAPRIMGIPELVEDGVSGILHLPGRSDLVAGAIETLAGMPAAARREMGLAGRAAVVDSYDLSRNVAELATVMSEVVDS
jgi:glycosyltransferase involved in cell wall biosynthesis